MTLASTRSFRLIAAAAFLAGWALAARAEDAPAYQSWGKQQYLLHCASCHGESGTGDGPAASELKTKPADLTGIALKHGGKFPHTSISNFIKGDFRGGIHGSREMPVWGRFFGQHDAHEFGNAASRAEVQALTDYLASIQRTK